MEPFTVRHYSGEERPVIKGNGFDGLEIGEAREEAERFVAFVNTIREQTLEEAARKLDREAEESRYEDSEAYRSAAILVRLLKRQ